MAPEEEDTTGDGDGAGMTVALAATLSAVFFFGSYILATIVNEALGRRGLPWAPLVYAVAFFPIAVLIIVYEDRIQQSRHWATLEKYWYHVVVGAGCLVPPLLVVFFGQSFWQSLPRGGAIGVAVTTTLAAGAALLARGAYAHRKNTP